VCGRLDAVAVVEDASVMFQKGKGSPAACCPFLLLLLQTYTHPHTLPLTHNTCLSCQRCSGCEGWSRGSRPMNRFTLSLTKRLASPSVRKERASSRAFSSHPEPAVSPGWGRVAASFTMFQALCKGEFSFVTLEAGTEGMEVGQSDRGEVRCEKTSSNVPAHASRLERKLGRPHIFLMVAHVEVPS
jgi:hypothetical protein